MNTQEPHPSLRTIAPRWPGRDIAARRSRVWRLRSHLASMLMASMLLTFSVVLGAIIVWRLPLIEQENRAQLQQQVAELASRVELLMGVRQSRMEFLARLARDAGSGGELDAILDRGVGNGESFQAFYRVSTAGVVESIGLPATYRSRRTDLIGSSVSRLPLLVAALQAAPATPVWSGHYLSPMTGNVAVGVAVKDGGARHVMIGELSRSYLLSTVQAAASANSERIWIVDSDGEVLADTDDGRAVRELNIHDWPLMQALLRREAPPREFSLDGKTLLAATAHSDTLGWHFIGSTPKGLDHARARVLLLYATGTLCGGLLVGLVVALYGAQHMARPLQEIVNRAALITSGQSTGGAWPQGPVAEFNALADDLGRMATALQQRERKLSAIFNAAPIPMVVYDVGRGHRVLDVNDAWCRELAYRREDVLGRTALEIGLWRNPQEREDLLRQRVEDTVRGETTLVSGTGETLLFQCHGRWLMLGDEQLLVWGSLNIGPLRAAEQDLRELNARLEAHITQRTNALAKSNRELSATVEHLRHAQAELVRSEKMAALGALVAGVAHELNTPLGNAVMAISTLQDAQRHFQRAIQGGLRRTDMQQFLEQVEQGTDIASRNLHRAASLVLNFKQVAVDQTSSQRRSFELHEVVHEMVVSLRPSFSRTPYRIEVDVPATGLRMESYAGALGQVIGNLIQNAVLHGFDGRSHGTVRIAAERADNGWIVLRVSDDGSGIPDSLIDRIFEPFVTTKMGQGGTGLGLHISYNAVVNLLGGTLKVLSHEGQGSCFEMRMPADAPHNTAPPVTEASAPSSE